MRKLSRFAPLALLLVSAAARAALPDTDADSAAAPPPVAARQPAASRSGAPRKQRPARPCHEHRRGARARASRTAVTASDAETRNARASEKAGA
ncbi:MAG: hypothetical protein ACM3SU_18850 [Acidobacteriota bacterium]